MDIPLNFSVCLFNQVVLHENSLTGTVLAAEDTNFVTLELFPCNHSKEVGTDTHANIIPFLSEVGQLKFCI